MLPPTADREAFRCTAHPPFPARPCWVPFLRRRRHLGIPIFEEIEKLINEHGSAVILKERLVLANDKYSALEKKAADLQTENERLKSDNIHLRQEVQRRDDIVQREESYRHLLDGSRMKWGCLLFAGDSKLYCPSCFHKNGRKIETSRIDTHNRFCSVCRTNIPSG